MDTIGKLWREFYQAEQDLYDFLNIHEYLHCIGGCEPVYRERVLDSIAGERVVMAPPKYVRCTIALNSATSVKTFHQLNHRVLDTHREAHEASRSTTVRLPDRFPQYFEGLSQINLTVNEAVQSIALDPDGCFAIMSGRYSYSFEEEIRRLKKYGIEAFEEKAIRKKFLMVDCKSLFKYAKAEGLQLRKKTGSRYIARVRHPTPYNEDKKQPLKRVRYGLLVLDKPCPIYHTMPTSEHSDRLEFIGEKVELPIVIDGELWKKSNPGANF